MSQFRSIEIDIDVHKMIEMERQSFMESPNDVLRRLFKIKSKQPPEPPEPVRSEEPLPGEGSQSGGQLLKRSPKYTHNEGRKRSKKSKSSDKRIVKDDIDRGQWPHVAHGSRLVEETSNKIGRSWWGKDVELPQGTKLRMRYNGRQYTGVIHNGGWLVEGRAYESPSAAAGGVARTTGGGQTLLNGWKYWDVKRPSDGNWIPINRLRISR